MYRIERYCEQYLNHPSVPGTNKAVDMSQVAVVHTTLSTPCGSLNSRRWLELGLVEPSLLPLPQAQRELKREQQGQKLEFSELEVAQAEASTVVKPTREEEESSWNRGNEGLREAVSLRQRPLNALGGWQ